VTSVTELLVDDLLDYCLGISDVCLFIRGY